MPGNERIPSRLISILTIGITLLIPASRLYSAEAELKDSVLLSKVLSQVKVHYFRTLTPAELNARSLDELFSLLDQETHLELTRPSSLDFVRGLKEEGSVAKVERLRHDWGYLQIAFFGRRTPRDFDHALRQFQEHGVKHLILDLRGDSGGSLESGIAVIEYFIPPNKLLFTFHGKNFSEIKRYSEKAGNISLDITVLIDEKTASTAEIVADALRRYAHAKLVGQPTHGKRSMQETFPVDSFRTLLLTTGFFTLPDESQNGRVKPDFLAPSEMTLQKATALLEEGELLARKNSTTDVGKGKAVKAAAAPQL